MVGVKQEAGWDIARCVRDSGMYMCITAYLFIRDEETPRFERP